MLAQIVDVDALWRTIWTAAVAGVLVTVLCSFAVLGAARRSAGAGHVGLWTAVAAAGSVATLALVAYGLRLVVA